MPAPTLARPDLQPEIDAISPCPRCLGPGKPRTPSYSTSHSAVDSQHVNYKCVSCGQTWSESRTSAFDRK